MKIKINKVDLASLHSLAVNVCIDLPRHSDFHKDTSMLQAYSYAVAMVNLLNSKNLLHLEVEIERGIKNE